MQLMEDQPWSPSKLRLRTCAFLDTKIQSDDDDLQLEVGTIVWFTAHSAWNSCSWLLDVLHFAAMK